MAAPERIVLSGGVMLRTCLFPLVRTKMQEALKGYIQLPQITSDAGIKEYIKESRWGNAAGLVGCLTLAQLAAKQKQGGMAKDKLLEEVFVPGRLGIAAFCVVASAFALRRMLP